MVRRVVGKAVAHYEEEQVWCGLSILLDISFLV